MATVAQIGVSQYYFMKFTIIGKNWCTNMHWMWYFKIASMYELWEYFER